MKEYKETNHNLIFKSLSDLAFYCAGFEGPCQVKCVN